MTTRPAQPGRGTMAATLGQGVRRQAPWWVLTLAAGATVASLPTAQAGWTTELALLGLPAALAWPLTLAGQALPWALALIGWVASPWAVGPLGSANISFTTFQVYRLPRSITREYSAHGGCGVAVVTWPVTRRSRRCYQLTLGLLGATLASSWWPALWADGLALPVALAAAVAMAAATTLALHLAARRRFRRPTPR
jgi:hypothetical protein